MLAKHKIYTPFSDVEHGIVYYATRDRKSDLGHAITSMNLSAELKVRAIITKVKIA